MYTWNLVTYLTTLSATYTSRILGWVWHVARIGVRCIGFFFWGGGGLRETENLEYLDVDGIIFIKMYFQNPS